MLRPESLLPDRQRLFVERLGLGIPALGVAEHCQVVQSASQAGVLLVEGEAGAAAERPDEAGGGA